jgi:membrane protein required for beta-lactamase induction
MTVYLGKDSTHATSTMTATQVTVAGVTIRTEYEEHKLYVNYFFFLTYLMIYKLCGTVRLN